MFGWRFIGFRVQGRIVDIPLVLFITSESLSGCLEPWYLGNIGVLKTGRCGLTDTAFI